MEKYLRVSAALKSKSFLHRNVNDFPSTKHCFSIKIKISFEHFLLLQKARREVKLSRKKYGNN
jgi:hypothetical protein